MCKFYRTSALAAALVLATAVGTYAKPTTINKITLDVPDGFEMSKSSRGVEVKTPDEEVLTWFEVYKGSEGEALEAEHEKYWNDNDVAANGDPEVATAKSDDNIDVQTRFFEKATWKGKPTVLRYVRIGPMGPDQNYVLMTVWASPEGINAHGNDVVHMINTLSTNMKR